MPSGNSPFFRKLRIIRMKRLRIKRILSVVLALLMIITVMPQSQVYVMAAQGSASLSNLGNLGTVNIGNKSESGIWLKTKVNGKAAFCLDLGKSCHTGYVYESSEERLSSDSKNKVTALKAQIGYWYAVTKKSSTMAWVYAQCLIWGVEEGITSESGLKDIISQVKKNTGYYSGNNLYSDIFGGDATVYCDVIQWKYSGKADEKYVQRLMQVTSGDEEVEPDCIDKKLRYRQRITLDKTDEDGKPLSQVEFTLEAKNVKELYSYKYNGWGDAESGDVDDDDTKFVADVLTDKNGRITFKFDYQLQSEDYYYYSDSDLEKMSTDDKIKVKDDLKSKGYKYANNLTKEGAEELAEKDLEKQLKEVNNKYILREVNTNNNNIIANGSIAEGITVTIKSDKSWTKVEGVWPDTVNGKGNYAKAYQLSVTNKYKKVKLTALKIDNETGNVAQGDATLEGAVYGMYEDAGCTKLMKKYMTDKNNQFETDYVRCGFDYYLKEITPPTGYLKNDKVYKIHEDGKQYTAEYNSAKTKQELGEDVIKGNVDITKIMTNGAVGITKPEINAEFQIYLASAGSYNKAKATEKDYLKTDAYGYAKSKDLPYGTYIVHQVKGADETEYVSDFYVDVKENGKTYKYILNNPSFTAYLKVVKKDVQTKKTVLKAGTTYQFFKVDENGKETIVKQSYSNGNKIETVDKFVTDESGEIITYKPLAAGLYRIREVQGPEGTYNENKFVDIKITNKSYKTAVDAEGNEYKYAECEYFNNETYGKFTVEKTGPSVAGFEEIKTTDVLDNSIEGNILNNKEFTYEDIFLNDVVFELYAKEDIVTQDNQGTNWFDAGEKVATITTGKGAEFTKDCNGICSYTVDKETGNVTMNLPLGKYELKEINTIYGYVLPEVNSWDLEFKWNSQTEKYVYDISGNTDNGILKVKNELPKTYISIIKKDSKSEKAVPGTVFGFYSKDNIYDRNGNVIVNAGEKIATVITDENGIAKVPFSVPLMSEGYQKANVEGETPTAGTSNVTEKTTVTDENVEKQTEAVTGEAAKEKAEGETTTETVTGEDETETKDEEVLDDVNAGLNSGDYFFLEESISDSYFIDEEPIFVHVEYKDQDTKVIKAEAVMENTQTEVEIDKMMIASSVELSDCHLVVSDKDGNDIVSWISGDSESVIITEKAEELGYENLAASVDEKGNIIVNGLLHGMEYTLSERKPADGYVTASDIKFRLDKMVNDEGEVTTKVSVMDENGNYVNSNNNKVVMYDDTTKVEFSKTDITGEKEVPGCDLEVTDKDTGKVMDQWTSTKHKHMTEGKYVVGKTYVMTEKRPADGFVTADSVEFTIADTGKVQGVSMKDDTTKIEFSKIASDTKKMLPGAKYKVLDSKGKKVYEFTTTDKAVMIDGILKAGETYTFVESKVPEHYKKAKDVKITVKDTGKVRKVKAVDERIPEVPNTPQTGAGRYGILFALLAMLGGLTTYSCIRVNHGKKRKDEE